MLANDRHMIYQVLTKRPERMLDYVRSKSISVPRHIWMGTSVENKKVVHRIDTLRKVDAKVRFLSVEPLLGPLPELNLDGIHWVIVGGESGPKYRPMEEEWVQDVLRMCREQDVPFFFKQWGGRTPKANGRLLNGREYSEFPRGFEKHPVFIARSDKKKSSK